MNQLIKMVCFSDTHTLHGRGSFGQYQPFIGADYAIFAGDMCNSGHYKSEILNFIEWFKNMPVTNKICIAGNHDRLMEVMSHDEIEEIFKDTGIIYLNDSSVVINDIKFHGSPITPYFFNWAFNRHSHEIDKHWQLIPDDTDILITHGPAYGYLDLVNNRYDQNKRTGCPELLKHIERIKPKYHICGHIHCGYGTAKNEHTTFINAAVLDEEYKLVNEPIYIYYE